MSAEQAIRVCFAFLCVSALSTGLPAAFDPVFFFEDFPLGAGWVELLPPYNEHLVTDVGGFYLGSAILFGWAAWRPQAELVRAVASAWILVGGLHLLFHVFNLENYSAADGAAQIASLTAVALPAVVALLASTRLSRAARSY